MVTKRNLKHTMLSRYGDRVERIILVFFAAITLFMPLLYLQANYYIVAVAGLAITLVTFGNYQHTKTYAKTRRFIVRHPILVLGVTALLTRLLWVVMLSPHINQVSDFLDIYNDSLQSIPSSRHVPNWTHFITFPYILHFFVGIFGSSTLVGGVVNAIVMSVSVVLVYLLGVVVVNKRVGFIAAIMMILWPGVGVFTSIYAPDHFTVLFLLLSILCFTMFIESQVIRVKIGYIIACAASMWALGFFKDLAPILLIAFALTLSLVIARSGQMKKSLVAIGGVLGLCVFVAFSAITHIPIISAIAHQPVNPSLVPYFIYTGLGGNNMGSWQPEIMDHYNQLIGRDGQNYDHANKTMLHEALHSVKQRLSELPVTIWNKNRTVQANDEAKIFWVDESAGVAGSKGLKSWLETVLQPINGIFFAAVVILMSVGVYYAWRVRVNTKFMLLVIICAGYSLLLLVIEAQNRYRYMIEPLYCIVAAYGLMSIYHAYVARRTVRNK